ncbi:MAG: NfeD family protein [Bacteroidia bacterium]|nr:NfeD family protein [Bacteroidia bacterium]
MDLDIWWQQKETFEKIFWIIAFPSSLVFLGLMIMTIFGGDNDAHTEVDGDFEVDDGGIEFQFITVKNLVAFLTMFGWIGIAGIDMGWGHTKTIVIALIAGLVMMFIVSGLFYFMAKMTGSGTLVMNNAIGNLGEVYLTIPENKSGMGKVQLKVQGTLRELDAMSDGDQIPTGKIVKVVDVINDHILVVSPVAN